MIIEHKGIDLQLDHNEAEAIFRIADRIYDQWNSGDFQLTDSEVSIIRELAAQHGNR